MHRVIVVGSPRPDGRSALLADELFNACIEECPEDGVSIVSVASAEVAPCMACDACAKPLEEADGLPAEGDPLEPCALVAASDAALHRCVIDDDMPEVRKHLDAADELIVVSPVYFAGAPAQFKALLDRMQPYFRSNLRALGKRPMILHVVGEGGDPHGFEPLISTVRSAFSVAGFELELVLDWVGKIDEQGEIIAEADEYPIPPRGGFGALEEGFDYELVEADFSCGGDESSMGALPCNEGEGIDDARLDDDGDKREHAAPEARRSAGKAKLSLSADGASAGGKQGKGGSAQGGKGASRSGGKSQGASGKGGSKGSPRGGNPQGGKQGRKSGGKGGSRRG